MPSWTRLQLIGYPAALAGELERRLSKMKEYGIQEETDSGNERFWLQILLVAVLAQVPTAAVANQGNATYEGSGEGAASQDRVHPYVFNGDLRDLPLVAGRPGENESQVPSPLGHRLLSFSSPDLNFEGQEYTTAPPPDTVGDVGSQYYIQMVNWHDEDQDAWGSQVTAYDKRTGALQAGPFYLHDLAEPSSACSSGGGDPIVLYDHFADRWLLSELASQFAGTLLCVYISKGPDPLTDGWFSYEFQTPFFPDYPKYAVWHDAYYVSSNDVTEAKAGAHALDRISMLAGDPGAEPQYFSAPALPGFQFNSLTPSDVDGPVLPPFGSPNFFVRHRDDEFHGSPTPVVDFLEIWEFSVDWDEPANSSFQGPIDIPISDFSSNLAGIPQPTGPDLAAINWPVMWRLQYRNFVSHEVLVGNLVTDVDGTGHAGIRWFELRRSPPGAGFWRLHQEGTHAPDAHHRWLGSIAMDGCGNIALGYSVSSDTVFPGIRYAGRIAHDPLGVLTQGEYTIMDGEGSKVSRRWGDYSSMNVDEEDQCTFWYTNEYLPDWPNPVEAEWRTRIAAFRFPSCTGLRDSDEDAIPDCLDNCLDGPNTN